MPTPIRLKIRATPQADGHSCGFCAMSSIYRYYGLSPRQLKLREELGTDHWLPLGCPARARIERSMTAPPLLGTWPHDMFATLHRGGFTAHIAPTHYPAFQAALKRHLRAGHPALALMNQMSHWVVISGAGRTGVWIVDSNLDEDSGRHVYFMEHTDYERSRNGEILVSRRASARFRSMSRADYIRAFHQGNRFLIPTLGKAGRQLLNRLLP